MRFIKYLTIFVLLAVQYSFQESSSENPSSLEILPSAEDPLLSEGISSSEDGLVHNDDIEETNLQEASPLENVEETNIGGVVGNFEQNLDSEVSNNEEDNLSKSISLVDSVVSENGESMSQHGSNSDEEDDNKEEEEDLPKELPSENLEVPNVDEVNEQPGPNSNDKNDSNEEAIIPVELTEVVPEVPETVELGPNSIETVEIESESNIGRNRFSNGLKKLRNKFGDLLGSGTNKLKNFYKNSKNKLTAFSRNLKNKFSGLFGRKHPKQLAFNDDDSREKRSILKESVSELGRGISKAANKVKIGIKKLFSNKSSKNQE